MAATNDAALPPTDNPPDSYSAIGTAEIPQAQTAEPRASYRAACLPRLFSAACSSQPNGFFSQSPTGKSYIHQPGWLGLARLAVANV